MEWITKHDINLANMFSDQWEPTRAKKNRPAGRDVRWAADEEGSVAIQRKFELERMETKNRK